MEIGKIGNTVLIGFVLVFIWCIRHNPVLKSFKTYSRCTSLFTTVLISFEFNYFRMEQSVTGQCVLENRLEKKKINVHFEK